MVEPTTIPCLRGMLAFSVAAFICLVLAFCPWRTQNQSIINELSMNWRPCQ